MCTRQLGLMQLERRRVRIDLIETFKIMNGMYDINCDLFSQLDEGDRNCLRKDSDLTVHWEICF